MANLRESENQPSCERSEILRLFFAKPPSSIAADLENVNHSEIRVQEKQFSLELCSRPQDVATSFHRRRLLGSNMRHSAALSPDLILFGATLAAHELAEMACGCATGKGSFPELFEENRPLYEICSEIGKLLVMGMQPKFTEQKKP